ncbi:MULTISPECIES: LysR family transcriptional regulator [unclassified Janthinobacterium]|uniref:LysR family transcriptional regulator n=1 Tax=unclassified Janthinobacterium TaxID=2610881 RepID=UPI00161CCA23|nr:MULTISPECIES: LysR family transcriptional regulator [unclassified Janthinobacterium]MBB5367395.1 DNA-binding transcriptional LysR family regulator [Janthinobacterium sp. K2C7]MBB5380127.1 DNA-binding transcriptional LysR family regulator [Janthinobacterium sp. K2Li3]MBB5385777.1 DNA-binding transcriptional LysR family regulator [Janthinobacterium sp. K2E3]
MKRTGLIELNAVVAVANQRSFRKAAAELGMSSSALSHAIASLEARLGVRLFHRTTRSVALSEAGQQFLARVQPALGQIAEAMDGVNAFRDTPSGTLRINTSEGAAKMILAPLVLAFLARYPDMQVDIVTEGRLVDIVAEGFDAGIRAMENVPLDMIAVPCTPPLRFAVVGSPAYFARHAAPLSPDELHQHRCVRSRLPGGALYKWEFERSGERFEIDPHGPLTLDNHHLMIAAALHGEDLIWTNEWAVANLLAEGRLVRVLEDWSPALPGLCLYYPGHRHVSAGMKAFLAMLRASYGEHAPPS